MNRYSLFIAMLVLAVAAVANELARAALQY